MAMQVGDKVTMEELGVIDRPVVRLLYDMDAIGCPLQAFVVEREDGTFAVFKLVRKTPETNIH